MSVETKDGLFRFIAVIAPGGAAVSSTSYDGYDPMYRVKRTTQTIGDRAIRSISFTIWLAE